MFSCNLLRWAAMAAVLSRRTTSWLEAALSGLRFSKRSRVVVQPNQQAAAQKSILGPYPREKKAHLWFATGAVRKRRVSLNFV
jgi:hypothetical protein